MPDPQDGFLGKGRAQRCDRGEQNDREHKTSMADCGQTEQRNMHAISPAK
jgi:hypothetical protein